MTKEEIFAIVQSNIQEVLMDVAHEAIQPDRQLKDLGANSIDRMDIVTMSMEDTKVKIPLVEFAKVSNIGELVDTLHAHSKGSGG